MYVVYFVFSGVSFISLIFLYIGRNSHQQNEKKIPPLHRVFSQKLLRDISYKSMDIQFSNQKRIFQIHRKAKNRGVKN